MRRWRSRLNMLIVEDNPGDAVLFQTFFRQEERPTSFHIVNDGEEALNFLHKRGEYVEASTPDIVVIDINVPKIDGRDVLKEIKSDSQLRVIPAIVLTSSDNEEDVRRCYMDGANCVLRKASDVDEATHVFQMIEDFWVNLVQLPTHKTPSLPHISQELSSTRATRLG